MKSSAQTIEFPPAPTATMELTFRPTCSRTLRAILADCQDCCRDDVVSLVEELPTTEAIEQMRVRRIALWRYQSIINSLSDNRVDIPIALIDEVAQVSGYRIEHIADKLKALGRMGWDDAQHFDPEILANEIYDVHDLLIRLRRMQLEIERGLADVSAPPDSDEPADEPDAETETADVVRVSVEPCFHGLLLNAAETGIEAIADDLGNAGRGPDSSETDALLSDLAAYRSIQSSRVGADACRSGIVGPFRTTELTRMIQFELGDSADSIEFFALESVDEKLDLIDRLRLIFDLIELIAPAGEFCELEIAGGAA